MKHYCTVLFKMSYLFICYLLSFLNDNEDSFAIIRIVPFLKHILKKLTTNCYFFFFFFMELYWTELHLGSLFFFTSNPYLHTLLRSFMKKVNTENDEKHFKLSIHF